jgi:hypothetical protein
MYRTILQTLLILFSCYALKAQQEKVRLVNVDSGWAANSVNTVIFRKNSLVSFGEFQFIGFYNKVGQVVIGKRKSNEQNWELKVTHYKGNIKDAHNDISIMIDVDGYLHMSWDHHNNPLNYCKSQSPLSLELTDKTKMTGYNENSVSYPEFYSMPNGDLLFFYRDGGSGKGNLVINRYNTKTKEWKQLHSNLIDGEGKRNAYWQACIDNKGVIHISWVWRESPDVASNHDICYTRSRDGGTSWEKSTGEKYITPISAATAEYAIRIPQKTELINQTSMCTDDAGNPYIASYWRERESLTPQYHIVYKNKSKWEVQNLGFRESPFSLSGAGTKHIPISRPQIVAFGGNQNTWVALIFKDEERNSKVSVAINKSFKKGNKWEISDLTAGSVGGWEPTYDTELWRQKKILNLFIQYVEQKDSEGISNISPQMIQVLEWKPR